jgi:hypothetical protein
VILGVVFEMGGLLGSFLLFAGILKSLSVVFREEGLFSKPRSSL